MLPHLFLASLGFVHQSNSAMTGALRHALARTFNSTAGTVDIGVQTNSNDNRVHFLDIIDGVVSENDWNFGTQINVNNVGLGTSGRHSLWFVDSYHAFRQLYSQISGHASSSVLFLLLVLRLPSYEAATELMDRLFSDLLHAMVVNVDILIEPAPGEVLIYTSDPFRGNTCRSTESVLLNRFFGGAFESSEFFPSRGDSLHGCPLRIIAKNAARIFLDAQRFQTSPEGSGLEAEILGLIAAKMNFTPTVTKSLSIDHYEQLTNLTATGFYELLENGEADIIVGSQVHDPLLDQLFSASRTYFHNRLVLSVRRPPCGLPKLSWLFTSLDDATWICISVLVVVTALIIALAAHIPLLARLLRLKRDYSRALSVIAVAVGMSTPHYPRISFLRLCFFLFSMGMLNLRIAHNGKMFDSYNRATSSQPPVTMPELLSAQYTVYSWPGLAQVVEHWKGLVKVDFQNGTQIRAAPRTAVLGSKAVIIADTTAEELGSIAMHELQTQLFCLILQKHSILTPQVDRIIAELDRGGFLQFWARKYKFYPTSSAGQQATHTPRPLSLQQFQYVMLCIGGSLAFASIVFLLELSWPAVKRWRRAVAVRNKMY